MQRVRAASSNTSRQTGEQDGGVVAGRCLHGLVQDQLKRPGFLLLLPMYAKGKPHGTLVERRENIQGWKQ